MLSFEECMMLPPIENPLCYCFQCTAGMCEICKKPQYYYKLIGDSTYSGSLSMQFLFVYGKCGEEYYKNKYREKILKEILIEN